MRRQMDDVFGRALGDERAGPPAAAWNPVTEITSSDEYRSWSRTDERPARAVGGRRL